MSTPSSSVPSSRVDPLTCVLLTNPQRIDDEPARKLIRTFRSDPRATSSSKVHFPSLSIGSRTGQYLHCATLVPSSTRSQPFSETTAEPHHHYRQQVRRQRPGQGHLLPAGAVVHGGLVVGVARADSLRFDVHPRRRLDLMHYRRRLLRRFRLRRTVAGTLIEAIFVVGEGTVA